MSTRQALGRHPRGTIPGGTVCTLITAGCNAVLWRNRGSLIAQLDTFWATLTVEYDLETMEASLRVARRERSPVIGEQAFK